VRHLDIPRELHRTFDQPLHLLVGNAMGMQVSFRGQTVDLTPYTRNNVARIELK